MIRMRSAWILAGVLVVLAAVFPVEAQESGRAAVQSAARGDYAAAVEQLTALEARNPDLFRANNYDYLLGRIYEYQGDLAKAVARYTDVLNRGSNLSEYALWRLAGLARLEGNLPLERQYLTRLRASHPSSLLANDAAARLTHNALESGDYRTAVRMLASSAGTRGSSARDALARLSLARLRLGEVAEARSGFTRLLEGSEDDYALAAARGLDEIEAAEGTPVTPSEHLRRGRVYMANRDWAGARRHFLALAEEGDAGVNRAEALYNVGLTHYRVDEYDKAVEWWDRAAREFPNAPSGIKAFYWVGHAQQRAGNFDAALERYEAFIKRYPNDDQVEGAYRNAIDTARSAGDARTALLWAERAERAEPRSALATFAAFNRAKTLLSIGENERALAELQRLSSYNLSAGGPGMPTSGEVEILRGVALERLGRVRDAVSLYLSMDPGRESYFGNRATLRLRALGRTPEGRRVIEPILSSSLAAARSARQSGNAAAAKAAADRALRLTEDEKAREEMLDVLRFAYRQIPAYARVSADPVVDVARDEVRGASGVRARTHASLGAELAFLGLWDEAAPELQASGLGARSPHSMMIYNARGGRAHEAVARGEAIARRLPSDYRVELLPRGLAELIYPAPYRAALRRFALPLGVDPRFELSIARQESRFKPWVKSPAAARGLVQFIPETANRYAEKLGLRNFQQDDLYNPEVAVRFGARYLADLFELFPGNPYAVAASYNGGEDNVARWIRRAGSPDDIDLIVADIGYRESKNYVFHVMNNYWAYQDLYTQELNPR